MSSQLHRLTPPMIALLIGMLSGTAWAERDEHQARTTLLPAYQQECGTCHTAFPPNLLPAASWQRMMLNLQHHFGTDASVDSPKQKQLTNWLAANAGTGRRTSEAPPQDRITRSAWFLREHRKVSASTWKSSTVKSAANCAACHQNANEGEFNEHDIRIPR